MDKCTAEFKVTLSVGECNGFMNTTWYVNNQLVTKLTPTTTDDIELCFDLPLPGTITLVVDGKNLNTDTQLDSNGNIIADKFIAIKQASLARHPIPMNIFNDICKFNPNDRDPMNITFFGFPGTANIEFDEANPVVWHLKHNHYKVS